MKNGVVIVIILVVFFVGVYYIKQKLNDIDTKFKTVRFFTISKDEIFGEFIVKIDQPFGKIDISNLELNFYLDGTYISAINQSEPNATVIGNDMYLTAQFRVDPKKVFTLENALNSLVKIGQNQYTIKGELTVKKYGISAKLPIEITDVIKLN